MLKELADLDNPMRTPVGDQPGEGGLFVPMSHPAANGSSANGSGSGAGRDETPDVAELDDRASVQDEPPIDHARPDHRRTTDLPSVAVDPDPGEPRSRFDPDAGVVFYNDRHADYLLVKDDEATLLDYLATLVAKEYVLYNNPRAANDQFAEEMVRMLVRVRRHLIKRR